MTSRRSFLKAGAVAGTGLALGFTLPSGGRFARAAGAPEPFAPNAFLRISPDDAVTVVVKHAEMGQGVSTSLPMIVAEELDAPWDKVGFELAPAGPAYYHTQFGIQMTGGSTSVASAYEQMRKAGATARAMLIGAAAAQWSVPAESCTTDQGFVHHKPSGRKASYGALSSAAAGLPVPENVALKDPKNFRIIGKPTARLDGPAKVDGTSQFGLDAHQPGMLTAVVARAPKFGATLKKFDAAKAEALKGVVKVAAIKTGVAVIAKDFWTAKKGRDLLVLEWDTPADVTDSTALIATYRDLAGKQGATVNSRGSADGALKQAAATVEADYVFPYLAHAPMEPLNCTVLVGDGTCTMWVGTQFQTGDQMAAAQILGITPDKVTVNSTMLGGGFGRRANKDADFTAEAVMVAAQVKGTPVRTVWTREDDTRGGYYRPLYVHRVKAGVDDAGEPLAWHQRIVGQSILTGTPFEQYMVKDGVDVTSVEGSGDMPYPVPNLQVEYHLTQAAVPVLWWRSVGHTHTAFVAETMMDELFTLGKKDPLDHRLKLLAEHPRHMAVLKLLKAHGGWDKPLAEKPGMRRGRGLAVHESFGSVVGEIAEVSVAADGTVSVDRVVCAVDCGTVVNPRTVEAQLQGAVVFGLTAALHGKITLKDGAVEQSNFHDYPALRMHEMPQIEVHLVQSDGPPTGIGEPGTPPIGPAVCNAVFRATGKRVRGLPIDPASLKA